MCECWFCVSVVLQTCSFVIVTEKKTKKRKQNPETPSGIWEPGVCLCVCWSDRFLRATQFLVSSHSVFGCQQRCQSSVKARQRWVFAVCSIGRNGFLPFFPPLLSSVNITCSVTQPSLLWPGNSRGDSAAMYSGDLASPWKNSSSLNVYLTNLKTLTFAFVHEKKTSLIWSWCRIQKWIECQAFEFSFCICSALKQTVNTPSQWKWS